MITFKGNLHVGIDFCGKNHTDYEIRPSIMRDTLESMNVPEYKNNDMLLGLSVLSKQLMKLGDIPKDQITVDLLLGLTEHDLQLLVKAKEDLELQLSSFQTKPVAKKSSS